MAPLKYIWPILLAFLGGLPGLLMRLLGWHSGPIETTIITGIAILAASFMLMWACDVAQTDIPQTLALAIVALVAVLPEYAVDMYFTWKAGKNPQSDYALYAIANMTGANRLIIGVGWAVIVGLTWLKTRGAIALDAERRTEVLFLGLATVYAFVIPFKGTLAWYDGVILVSLYVWYIKVISKRPLTEFEMDGPAHYIIGLPAVKRRPITVAMFLYSAGVILASAEPFSEGLVASGKLLGINEFLLVQWLAPLASEAPEFTVAIMMALRGSPNMALGSLLSSKLNQWTLLVGMIPMVFGISAQTFSYPIPMGHFQMNEIFLTAAQSLLAVGFLTTMRLTPLAGVTLFVLFAGQMITPAFCGLFKAWFPGDCNSTKVHLVFSIVYIVLALGVIARKPVRVVELWAGARSVVNQPLAVPGETVKN